MAAGWDEKQADYWVQMWVVCLADWMASAVAVYWAGCLVVLMAGSKADCWVEWKAVCLADPMGERLAVGWAEM